MDFVHLLLNDWLIAQIVLFARIQESISLRIFSQLIMFVDFHFFHGVAPISPPFYPPAAAISFESFHEVHCQLCPFHQLKEFNSPILKLNFYLSIRILGLPGLILMSKFSRIRAKSVVVKPTLISSSIGIFIRMSFLYATRFGHLLPKPSGGSIFFSISYIFWKWIFPLRGKTEIQLNIKEFFKKKPENSVRFLLSFKIIFAPNSNKFVQMMCT